MANKTVEKLANWGCDTKGALERMLGDEEMYESFVIQYKDSFDISELSRHVAAGNVEEAFELAHTMKGVYGNLGLTPLYDAVCKAVEILRTKTCGGADVFVNQLAQKKAELDELLSK